MSDILCIYYSRTGNTRRAVEEIAGALDAEVVAITDDRDRSGWKGYLRSGMDDRRSQEVYDQMDLYTAEKRLFAVSLRPGSEGYDFWRTDFIQNVQRWLEQN